MLRLTQTLEKERLEKVGVLELSLHGKLGLNVGLTRIFRERNVG